MRFKLGFSNIISYRGIATIYLITMCMQFFVIEGGYGVSPLKVVLMSFAPLLLLTQVPYMTKATLWCSVYMIVVLFCVFTHDYVRFSTVGFLGMFLITYIVYYNLLYKKHAFSLMYFIKLLRFVILAYFIVLILQQLLTIVNVVNVPLINLLKQDWLFEGKYPTWNLEPSHAARVLGVFYYAYLQCCEIVEGKKISLKRIFEPFHRWITIGYLYTMITMGSGTAFIVLMIQAIYFVQAKRLWYVIPVFCIFYFVTPFLNIRQLNRAINVINATMTLNTDIVTETDNSAASRINPMISTLKMDLSSKEIWFGKGAMRKEDLIHENGKVGNIDQYGLLSYIIALLFVFSCCIRVKSIGAIMFCAGVGGGVVNFAYRWGMLMIFTAVRYFQDRYEN